MTDDRDQILRNRFAALPDRGTGDWNDVVRRAAVAQPSRAVPRRWYRPALGGAVAVAVALCVGMILLIATGGNRETVPADDGTVHTVHQRVTSEARDGTVVTEQWIDFDRGIARIRTNAPSTPDDPVAQELIVTPALTYAFVPERLRQRTGGKAWVAAPSDPSQLATLERTPWSAPSVESLGGPSGTRLGLEAVEARDGISLRRLMAVPVNFGGDSLTVWIDPAGRLRRAEREFGMTRDSMTTEAIAYNAPIEVAIPAKDETFTTAGGDAADAILRPESPSPLGAQLTIIDATTPHQTPIAIDFVRGLMRPSLSSEWDSIASREFTYFLLPDSLRAKNQGKPWVRVPTPRDLPAATGALDPATWENPERAALLVREIFGVSTDPGRVRRTGTTRENGPVREVYEWTGRDEVGAGSDRPARIIVRAEPTGRFVDARWVGTGNSIVMKSWVAPAIAFPAAGLWTDVTSAEFAQLASSG